MNTSRAADPVIIRSLSQLVDRAEALIQNDVRHLLAIAGPPGAGKSTVAGLVEMALLEKRGGAAPRRVAQVPLDGFHYSNRRLQEMHARDRKGAPHTFDFAKFKRTLEEVRNHPERRLTVPSYSRTLHEPQSDGHEIESSVALIISEGNYLLLNEGHWRELLPLFDESWFVAVNPEVARRRLVEREVKGGRTRSQAEAWVDRNDRANARVVTDKSSTPDVQVELPENMAMPN
jgi:pantothenate kinase